MTDYRSSLKSKLAELEKERERIRVALSVLDEIDSENLRRTAQESSVSSNVSGNGTLPEAVIKILKDVREGLMIKAIHEIVKRERGTQYNTLYTALRRLQARGKIIKENNLWKAVEPELNYYPRTKQHSQFPDSASAKTLPVSE